MLVLIATRSSSSTIHMATMGTPQKAVKDLTKKALKINEFYTSMAKEARAFSSLVSVYLLASNMMKHSMGSLSK